MTGTGTNIDKVSKLFDVLDKHIKEENCQYIPNELLKEYEKNNEYLYWQQLSLLKISVQNRNSSNIRFTEPDSLVS